MQALEVEGIQEIHWVCTTPESLFDFFYFKIRGIANNWREKHDFGIHDTLVFDGELIETLRR